jgi:hypothetical protein
MFASAILLTFVKRDAPNANPAAESPKTTQAPGAAMPEPAPGTPAGGGAPDGDLERIAAKRRPEPPASAGDAAPSKPLTEAEARRYGQLMDRMVAAYPDFLQGHDGAHLIWRDGARMAFDDGRGEKALEARLASADLEDQFSLPYPAGPMLNDPAMDFDPGRARNAAFFEKMYGDCRKGEVQKKLAEVAWLPKNGGKTVKITSVNGVAEKLKAVSEELDALPKELIVYVKPVAGTFNCRKISQTDQSSAHGYGIAIDINAKFGDYWQWGKPGKRGDYAYRNRIPWEIAAIFEKHGFIWGGKWYHFDTFHFEYRPELIAAAPIAGQPPDTPVPMPEKQPRNLE